VEHLYICGWKPRWQDDIEDSQWLEVLHPFTAVKYLYLSQTFAPRIAPALQELAGEVITLSSESFLGGSPPIGPVQGSHREVRCRATACQSPYSCLSLGRNTRRVVVWR
jgi:hypothetical protein